MLNIDATETAAGAANDYILARDMAEALNAEYPGHLWAVNVDEKNGIADIRNLMLSGQWGFRLKLTKNYSASDFKRRVIMGGGELLERYRVSRGRANDDNLAALPTDFSGRTIGDLSK
jgi:hypothetical protein